MKHLFYSGLILLALAWFQGCAWLVAPPVDDGQARGTLDRLMAQNSRMTQFKGLLNARVHTQGRSITGRVAVAAATPNQLRLEWLSPLGRPLTSMAGNGKKLTILSYADNEHHTLRQTPTVLKNLIHVPIGLEDLLTLLSGRPVVPEFHAVQEIEADIGIGLRLKNRWRRTLADMHIGPDGQLTDEQVFDAEGNLLYRIRWRQWQTIQAYFVPKRLIIATATGESVDITIRRLIPDADLTPSIFELSPPDPT